MHRVFVYGTLKRGFPNYDGALTAFRCLGRFRTVEAYPLVVGGKWFSVYLIDEPGEGKPVFGEIFEVDDDGLGTLDRLEGAHLPNGYHRITIAMESDDGGSAFEAYTYAKRRDDIDGIHSESLDEYAFDPRYVGPADHSSPF
jgi:gamma-glutamylaminecyclotransferase